MAGVDDPRSWRLLIHYLIRSLSQILFFEAHTFTLSHLLVYFYSLLLLLIFFRSLIMSSAPLPSVPLSLRPAFVENTVAMSKAIAIEALRQIMENDDRFEDADIEGAVNRLETVFVTNERRKAGSIPSNATTQMVSTPGGQSSSNAVVVARGNAVVPAAPVVREPRPIALPYTGVCDENCCNALECLEYIYTQCTNPKLPNGFCRSCNLQMMKSRSNVPKFGTIQQRMAVGPSEYRDPRGKKVRPYSGYMHRKGITKEEVFAEAERRGVLVEEHHLSFKKPGVGGKRKRVRAAKGKRTAVSPSASTRVHQKSKKRVEKEADGDADDFSEDEEEEEDEEDRPSDEEHEEEESEASGEDEEEEVMHKPQKVIFSPTYHPVGVVNKGKKRTIPKSKPFKEAPPSKRPKQSSSSASSQLTLDMSRQIMDELKRLQQKVDFTRNREELEDSQAIGSQLEIFDREEDEAEVVAKLQEVARRSGCARKELGSRPRTDKERTKSPAAQAKAVQRELAKQNKKKHGKRALEEEAEEAEEDEEEEETEDEGEDDENASDSDSACSGKEEQEEEESESEDSESEEEEESQDLLASKKKPMVEKVTRTSSNGVKVVLKKSKEVRPVFKALKKASSPASTKSASSVVQTQKKKMTEAIKPMKNVFDSDDEEEECGDGRQPESFELDEDDDATVGAEEVAATQKQKTKATAATVVSRVAAPVREEEPALVVSRFYWEGVMYLWDEKTGNMYDEAAFNKGETVLVGNFCKDIKQVLWKQAEQADDEEEQESQELRWSQAEQMLAH